jgi:beta-glucanase (GH16 family)
MRFQLHQRDQRHHRQNRHRGVALLSALVVLVAIVAVWTISRGAGPSSASSLGAEPTVAPTAGASASSSAAAAGTTSAAPITTPPTTTPPPTTQPPALRPLGPGGSWTMAFDDEFSGDSVNPQNWATTSVAEPDGGHGNLSNFQLEWDQGQNCSVAGGALTITAERADVTSSEGNHYGWTSCLLSSKPSFAFHYGYMEMRAELPYAAGFWPGFWTWQTGGPDNETDAMEYYSNDRYHVSLFQHSDGRGGCAYAVLPFNATTGYHTYGADIQPSGTTWYLDGHEVCSTSATSTGMTNLMLTMFVYSKSPPTSGTQSAAEEIDYVRVWANG